MGECERFAVEDIFFFFAAAADDAGVGILMGVVLVKRE